MSNTEFWGILMDSLSTILAAVAIFLYIFFWIKDKTSSNYDVFDAIYLDLLKTGMDKPSFRNINKTSNYKLYFEEEELIQYEIYAYISWNFVETIFDKSDDDLLATWGPAIKYEASLHKEWMKDPLNKSKFKSSFYEFALIL
jgi:hypothetical protein